MKAESDLFFKTGELLQFLDHWHSLLPTVPERMQALWIELYERGYIEQEDVQMVQRWLAGCPVGVGVWI
jgi:hypothetical protein